MIKLYSDQIIYIQMYNMYNKRRFVNVLNQAETNNMLTQAETNNVLSQAETNKLFHQQICHIEPTPRSDNLTTTI